MKTLDQEAAKKIRYSEESDVLYLLFAEGEEEYFEEPIPGVHVEYDDEDNIIGIEIIKASQVLSSFLNSTK